MRHRFMAAASSALLLLTVVGVAPVAATVPVEIDVAPTLQVISGCPTATAQWTVYFDGGTSGLYTVSVTYGNGQSRTKQFSSGPVPWSYTYSVGVSCPQPWPQADFYQNWSASRPGGGGAAHDYTTVYLN